MFVEETNLKEFLLPQTQPNLGFRYDWKDVTVVTGWEIYLSVSGEGGRQQTALRYTNENFQKVTFLHACNPSTQEAEA
jgi:hypothetical protein